MITKSVLIVTLALTALVGSSIGAFSQTAKETAIKSGAIQLTSEEITKLIVGKTVTAMSGKKRFMFHYSKDNLLSGKMIGGKWSDTGYYGITDDNQVCLSMTKDKGRLRCLTLLKSNGVVRKYNARGKMTFELLEYKNGKAF